MNSVQHTGSTTTAMNVQHMPRWDRVIAEGRPLLIHGKRGTGKTSLIKTIFAEGQD